VVDHIRLAHEDGFGPLDLEHISVEGDVSLAEAQERASGFQVGLIRVEKFFEGSHIVAYAGPPPGTADYCWGGCPGALEEAIEVLRRFDEGAKAEKRMPRIHFVFGDYRGPIDATYGEKVVFVGDCATYQGTLSDELVSIQNLYQDRSSKDPHRAEHQDIFKKMLTTMSEIRAAKKRPYLRLEGCPVSVANLMLVLSELGGLPNPYLTSDLALPFVKHYAAWRGRSLAQRLGGQRYQVPGEATRGDARPLLDDLGPHSSQ
jgi:hypothetical protein